jgi:hypothetical protein
VRLAALGERDEEIASQNPEPFTAEQCSIAKRQARGVWIKSIVTGVVATLIMAGLVA